MRRLSCWLPTILLVLLGQTAWGANPEDRERFFREQIAPILVGRCLECHGAAKKGELDLRTRETAIRGGESGSVLTPGDPADSLLYEHVSTKEMPPKKPLTDKQIFAMKRWIEQGAYFPERPLDRFSITTDQRAGYDWWSLQPLKQPDPPEVKGLPATWQPQPIDRFVFAKLAEKGLQPSAPADPPALLRRATYDLLGLPPTPEELQHFLAACEKETGKKNQVGDKAYEALLDRLLRSPHYGEHWGRHWLDVVRFGESNGFERNVLISNAWPFRDYVIRSLNDDKPFDQFIKEHLAGDVLGPNNAQVAVGTTFLVCGPYDNVGNKDPVQAAQIRTNTIDEMIRATSTAFLGMTVGCSRCHDHKFDPISQRDYYSLYATFAGVRHGDRVIQAATSNQMKQAVAAIQSRIALTQQKLQEFEPIASNGKSPVNKSQLRRPVHPKINSERIKPVRARFLRMTITATNSAEPCIDELEVFAVRTGEGPPLNVAAASAGAKASSSGNYLNNPKHRLQHLNDGRYGNSRSWISNHAGRGWVQIEFAKDETIDRIVWGRDREGNYRDRLPTQYTIEVATKPGQWKTVASSSDRIPFSEGGKSTYVLSLVGLSTAETQQAKKLADQLQSLQGERTRLQQSVLSPRWWVGQFRQENGPFQVFLGGSPQRRGEVVQPASLHFIARTAGAYQLASNSNEDQRRMELAQWIVSPQQSLTPRVLANRLWHYHFGTGIVSTPSDFGYMGGRPTHPKLLDTLASELKHVGWRLKPMHRRIMLSRTYRQSSAFRPKAAKIDRESRLLWRFPPRRLSAEEIRDTALSITGKLNPRMGGPGFRLFKYVQDNVATYYPLDKHGPETYRRAVYHHNARAMQIDLLTEFDAPDCAFSTPRRTATTTPLQALTLLNHSFTVDMAGHLADRITRDSKPNDLVGQVRRAFVLAFARQPSQAETAAAKKLVNQHGLRAFCRALLNANELIYLN